MRGRLVVAVAALVVVASAAPVRGTDAPVEHALRYREHYGEIKYRCHGSDEYRFCHVRPRGVWRVKARMPLDASEADTWTASTDAHLRVGDRVYEYPFSNDTRLRLDRRKVRLARGVARTRLIVRWTKRKLQVSFRQHRGHFGPGELHAPLRRFQLVTNAEVRVGEHRSRFHLPLRARVTAHGGNHTLRRRLFSIRVAGSGELVDPSTD
jgi:hypothetical protein